MLKSGLLSSASLMAVIVGALHMAAPAAHADEAGQSASSIIGLEDVIITARRVEERLQDVPVAVTELSGRVLEQKGVVNTMDLKTVAPSLHVDVYAIPEVLIVGVRGQRNGTPFPGQDLAVQYYVNEVPFGFQYGLNQAMFDISSVQVLKGPQGTLFGRNSTGGAILVNPTRPEQTFGGYAKVGGIFFQEGTGKTLEGVLNVPVNDMLALRLGVSILDRDGYVRNVTPRDLPIFNPNPLQIQTTDYEPLGSSQTQSWRVGLLFTPMADFDSYFLYQGGHSYSNGYPSQLRAVNPSGLAATTYDGSSPTRPSILDALSVTEAAKRDYFWSATSYAKFPNEVNTHSVSNSSSWNLGNITLKNVMGYNHTKVHTHQDANGTPFQILMPVISTGGHEFSEEFQVQGDSFGGSLKWIAGIFYYDQEYYRTTYPLYTFTGTASQLNGGVANSDGISIFLNGTQSLSSLVDGLSLTAGVRYNHDNRNMHIYNEANPTTCNLRDELGDRLPLDSCFYDGSTSFSSISYTATLDYKIDETSLIYVAKRRGYRSGGYNVQAQTIAAFVPYKPEIVEDWELGLKKDWILGDMALRSNVAVYSQKYTNIQRRVYSRTDPTNQTILNAASASVDGGEIELTLLPMTGLELSGSYAFTQAKYKDFVTGLGDFTDYDFSFTPKTTFTLSGRYRLPVEPSLGEVSIGADYYWQSRVFWSDTDQGPLSGPLDIISQKGYGNLNIRVDWREILGSSVDLAFTIKNALNTEAYTFSSVTYQSMGFQPAYMNTPRFFGVELKYSFGN